MRVEDWLFGIFPFLFPNRNKRLREELKQALRERLAIVRKKLNVEEIAEPKLRFWLPYSSTFHLKGSIYLSYPKNLMTTDKLRTTFDHEISHYIQHSINQNLKDTYTPEIISWIYWFLTGKLTWGLADRAFQEGFATYTSYLTSGNVPKRLQNAKSIWQEGKRITLLRDADVIPYVLGFMNYCAIANSKSEDLALAIGLYAKACEWVRETENITVGQSFQSKPDAC